MASSKEITQLNQINKGLTTVNTSINTTAESYLKLVKTIDDGNKSINQNKISFEGLKEAQKQTKESGEQLNKLNKKVVESETKLKRIESERIKIKKQQRDVLTKNLVVEEKSNKILQKGKLLLQQRQKTLKQDIIISQAQKGAYDKINASLNKNIATWKRLSAAERNNSKEGQKLTRTIQKQDAELKKLDGQIGRSQRHVGNYGKALGGVAKNLLGALGVVGGVAAFAAVLKNSFKILAEFSQAQATVAATLGKTKDEIADLTQLAVDYGKGTKFTATQVSGMQNELAKLGFTMGEIGLQTGSILKLAEATGADLPAAAKVAGIAIKAFGLSAIDADRVASTLAISTTKSALSFADFETALSTAGPVADAFGFSIEDTVALLGKLRDSGFDASKSSTALRNILLNLADSNGALAKKLGGSVKNVDELIPALQKLRADGVSLNETLQLTDKRSVAAFNTLLGGADDVIELRDAITDANAALDEMVTTKTDNTVDAMTRMSSAWEGVILTFRESEGFFVGFFDGIANLLNTTTDRFATFGEKINRIFGGVAGAQARINAAVRQAVLESITKSNKEQLQNFIDFNKAEASAGDKFAQEVIKRAEARLVAIEEAEIKAEERRAQALARIRAEEQEKKDRIAKKASKDAEKLANTSQKEDEKFLSMASKSTAKLGAIERKEKEKSNDEFKKLNKEKLEDYQKTADEQAIIAREQADEEIAIRKEINEGIATLGIEGANALFQIGANRIEKELQQLEVEKLAKLDNDRLTTEQRSQIEAEFAKEEAKLRTKQAKNEKKQAIFNTLINTAAAIAKALPNIPLSIIAGALGAIQLGVIASQPIPQFAKGSKNTPDKFIAGESGRELMFLRDGTAMMADKPTYFEGNKFKGTTIKSNPETEKIMSMSEHRGFGAVSMTDNRILKGLSNVEKAIKSKPVAIFDKDYRQIGIESDNNRTIYLNRLRNG